MNYFAFLSFEVISTENYDASFFTTELEELGLYSKISTSDGNLSPLPVNTFIGEYKFKDKEELKNLLYTEVKNLFHSNGVRINLFIGIAEKATIGLETF
jgi:hypothetical protein